MQTEKSFLIENVLKVSERSAITAETASKLSIIRNEHNDKAIVFVGAGTCGLEQEQLKPWTK